MDTTDGIIAATDRRDDTYIILNSIAYHLCNISAAADVEPITAPFEAIAVSNALNNLFMLFDEDGHEMVTEALDSERDDNDAIGILVEVQLGDDRMALRANRCDKQGAAANLDYTSPENISGVGSAALVEFQQRLQEIRNDECTILMYFQQTESGLRFDYDITPEVDANVLSVGETLADRLRSAF